MSNPFVVGNWVRGDRFFGRTRIISEILEGARDAMWIAGTRRLGKTSLLRELERLTRETPHSEKYIPLFWDLQGARDWNGLAETLLESIEDAEEFLRPMGIMIDSLQDASVTVILRHLRKIARNEKKTLLLLCDECEELINIEENEPEALPQLRRIFQRGGNLRTVISATKRLAILEQREAPNTSPFLNGFMPPFFLGNLTPSETDELIERGDFTPGEKERIQNLCNGHPYLLQILCKRLFEEGDIEKVVADLQFDEMISHFFAVDFNYLNWDEKQILKLVLDDQGTDQVSLENRTTFASDNLSRIIFSLHQLGYLRREDGKIYVANFFFDAWLKRQGSGIFNPPALIEEDPGQLANTVINSKNFTSGEMVDHYRIQKLLGQGGMAKVFLASDQQLDRLVALKILIPVLAADQNIRDRFAREARTASALNHPNIATIYQIGEIQDLPYIALEYVDGGTLNEWKSENQMQTKQKILLMLEAAKGLQFAHSSGIFHRDVKPENIILSKQGVPKITDFGLARRIGSQEKRLTQTGATMGTLRYMSPEQAAGMEVDHRTDIFSFGVVLYEFLFDRLPFVGETEIAYLYAVINDKPNAIPPGYTDIPSDLDTILTRMLARQPSDRYNDFGAVIEAMEHLV